MKRFLLVFAFLATVVMAKAQDDIINNSKQINSNNTGARKPSTFKEGEFWDFCNCSSSSNSELYSNHIVMGNEIVETIDRYYFNLSWNRILSYIESLPSSINRDCIHQYYYECFLHSCDEENKYDIIRYGETYLKTGGEAELLTVLPIVAKMHALQGEETEVENWIRVFEQYSMNNDELFELDIQQLKQEVYELLHLPLNAFEEEIKGAWVNITSNNVVQHGSNNPMILFINDVMLPQGGAQLIKIDQSIDLMNINGIHKLKFNKPINVSQNISCNGEAGLLLIQFASEDIKDRTWLTDIASLGAEGARQISAELNATIWSSNASLPDKFKTSLLTDIAISGIGKLLSNMNYSSRTVEDYKIVLTPYTNTVLTSQLSHVLTTLDNEGHIIENKRNEMCHFIRWEESDSVCFISKNNKPITLNPFTNSDPLLYEYNKINKQTSFWRPQYSIPFFVGNTLGGCLIYLGILKSNSVACVAYFIGGVTAISASSMVPLYLASSKRTKLFKELNRKNIEKLHRKYRIAIMPSFGIETSAVGANVNLSF